MSNQLGATPGPYKIVRRPGQTLIMDEKEHHIICTMNPLNWDTRANENLLRASWELLQVVDGICLFPDVRQHIEAKFPGLIRQAQAALAKVEGK